MERREFLHNLAGLGTALELLSVPTAVGSNEQPERSGEPLGTFLCEFALSGARWKVYEDLSKRDGAIAFLSDRGERRVLGKSAEATFPEADPPYLGLTLKEIGMSPRDLLADKLLAGGADPDPELVKAAAQPLGSAPPSPGSEGSRLPWDSFVGTRECKDTMPVFPGGNTRTYHPVQYFPELTSVLARRRFEGLLGGWLPVTRKVMPVSESSYFELLTFGDVEARDEFIVQTWHRTTHVENERVTKAVYGYSYPAFSPARQDPKPERFYRALLVFSSYWQELLSDFCHASLPQHVWLDMSRHAFAKELMVRPGGVYPKYGAVDRDYYGSEYDGFQDIFTSSVYSNLEWGRFEQAKLTVDNYFTSFVDSQGGINMRGPERHNSDLLCRYWRATSNTRAMVRCCGSIRGRYWQLPEY